MNEDFPSYPQQEVTPEEKNSLWNKKLILIAGGAFFFILISVIGIGILLSRKKTIEPSGIVDITPVPEKIDPLPSQGVIESELIVLFRRGQGPDEIVDPVRKEQVQKVLEQAGVVSYERGYEAQSGPISYRLVLKPGTDLETAAKVVSSLTEVESVEGNVEAGLFN